MSSSPDPPPVEPIDTALDQQLAEIAAENVSKKVRQATANENPYRWPFELLQNALDGQRPGPEDLVHIDFTYRTDKTLVVSHTGRGFSLRELVRLICGGTTKDFRDPGTVGEFGTGFLATHVLSRRVLLQWVPPTDGSPITDHRKYPSIEIDRSLDDHITHARESQRSLLPPPSRFHDRNYSVWFTYIDVDPDITTEGLHYLQKILPYLYATCEGLGRVSICTPDMSETIFEPGGITEHELDERCILRQLEIIDNSNGTACRALRIGRRPPAAGSLTEDEHCRPRSSFPQPGLLAVVDCGDNDTDPRLRPLDSSIPKLFVTFPISASTFLPFEIILDGRFTAHEERDGIVMDPRDRKLVQEAMSALPAFVEHAVKSGWRDAHKLARLDVLKEVNVTFGRNDDELQFWNETVKTTALALAKRETIKVSARYWVPAKDHDGSSHYASRRIASFLDRSTEVDDASDGRLDYNKLHEVVAAIEGLDLPDIKIAREWTQIARGWQNSGIKLKWLTLPEIAKHIRDKMKGRPGRNAEAGKSVSDLPIGDVKNPFDWLATLFLWESKSRTGPRSVPSVTRPLRTPAARVATMDGFLPNQHGHLVAGDQLRIDKDLPQCLKDIANLVDLDLRAKLLHPEMLKAVDAPGFKGARHFICELLDGELTAQEATRDILKRFRRELRSGAPDASRLLDASDRLIIYFRSTSEQLTTSLKRAIAKCPVATADGKKTYPSPNRPFLAPVSSWRVTWLEDSEWVRNYRDLYREDRILDERYCGTQVLKTLCDAQFVIPAPLYVGKRTAIEPDLLRAISEKRTRVGGLREARFRQIALLPELKRRSKKDTAFAERLLRFALDVASRDRGWSEFRDFERDGAGKPVSLRRATWPFELKDKNQPWIPAPGKRTAREASEESLVEFAEHVLLENIDNAGVVTLLHVLGFREASIRRLEQDSRKKLGRDTEVVVRELLRTKYGLEPEHVDYGYDERVVAPNRELYYLEIKTTTVDHVSLTPKQASTAADHPERFVLCAVDMRHGVPQSLDASQVEPLARVITGIGSKIRGLRDELNLRTDDKRDVYLHFRHPERPDYRVSSAIWKEGISIREWVESLTKDR